MRTIRIAIIAYEGVAAINVTSPLEVFAAASRWAKRNSPQVSYQTLVLSPTGARITTDCGLRLDVDGGLTNGALFDTVIIPGGSGIFVSDTRDAIAGWLSANADSVKRTASICTGAFAIARTGLLDGRRVTTHWAHIRDLATRFPLLRSEPDAIFLRDGQFYSSAGATAGLDLGLALVEEDIGDSAALAIARELLIYRRRDGGQRQYADVPLVECERNAMIGKLASWISVHLEDDLSVDMLAEYSGLNYNELIRQFREAFGTTPAAFVKAMRMNAARQRLLSGESVVAIAKRYRFRNKGYFTQEFKWRYGITPEDYKNRFSSASSAKNDNVDLQRELLAPAIVHSDFAGISMYGSVRLQLAR